MSRHDLFVFCCWVPYLIPGREGKEKNLEDESSSCSSSTATPPVVINSCLANLVSKHPFVHLLILTFVFPSFFSSLQALGIDLNNV